jgi:hypothetical protein
MQLHAGTSASLLIPRNITHLVAASKDTESWQARERNRNKYAVHWLQDMESEGGNRFSEIF